MSDNVKEYDMSPFLEVVLTDSENFLKIRETLTRIGVMSEVKKTLTQTCHILHKRGKFYIMHFKEMFILDNYPSDFSEDDRARRNSIANLLASWGMVNLVDPSKSQSPVLNAGAICIVPFKDKKNYKLIPKYTFGSGEDKFASSKAGIGNKSVPVTSFQKVRKWHHAFGYVYPTYPYKPDDATIILRWKLITEEYNEVMDELFNPDGSVKETIDFVNLAKELSDLDYVVSGTSDTFGINHDVAFDRVYISNMSKLGDDGKPVRREDGKVLKSKNYKPAVISIDDLIIKD